FVVLVIALPDLVEALEHEHRAGGAEEIIAATDIDPGLGESGGGHLAGDKALPDQTVETVLVGTEVVSHRVRSPLHVGRPDRLVGILHWPLGFPLRPVPENVGRSVALRDELPGHAHGGLAYEGGGGGHVSD